MSFVDFSLYFFVFCMCGWPHYLNLRIKFNHYPMYVSAFFVSAHQIFLALLPIQSVCIFSIHILRNEQQTCSTVSEWHFHLTVCLVLKTSKIISVSVDNECCTFTDRLLNSVYQTNIKCNLFLEKRKQKKQKKDFSYF